MHTYVSTLEPPSSGHCPCAHILDPQLCTWGEIEGYIYVLSAVWILLYSLPFCVGRGVALGISKTPFNLTALGMSKTPLDLTALGMSKTPLDLTALGMSKTPLDLTALGMSKTPLNLTALGVR